MDIGILPHDLVDVGDLKLVDKELHAEEASFKEDSTILGLFRDFKYGIDHGLEAFFYFVNDVIVTAYPIFTGVGEDGW